MLVFIPKGREYYYVKFEHQRKQYFKSLGTPVKAVAQKRARQFRKAIVEGKWADVEALKSINGYATLGQIVERYLTVAVGIFVRKNTAVANTQALFRLARANRAPGFDVSSLKANELGQAQFDAYVAGLHAKAKSKKDGWAVKRVSISANSTLRLARSLFSKRALKLYSGLKLPDKAPLSDVSPLPEPSGGGYQPIEPARLEKMELAAKALKFERPQVWLTYFLFSRLGMRNKEIMAARWDWIENTANGPMVAVIKRADFEPKAAERWIPIDPSMLAEMREFMADPGDFIIAPRQEESKRKYIIYCQTSDWVKQFLAEGRRSRKTSYELRKHVGSVIATREGNLMAAQAFLGHTSPTTTAKYYAKLLRPIRPISAGDLTETSKPIESK